MKINKCTIFLSVSIIFILISCDDFGLFNTPEIPLADGINWENFKMVIDFKSEGTFDIDSSYTPCVIKDGDKYKMWYSGDVAGVHRIIYCDSRDGINWHNYKKVIDINAEGFYDTLSSFFPRVIKDGNKYKMWYTGYNASNYRIIYCESNDGINWNNFQMVIDTGSQGAYDSADSKDCCVIKDGDTYKMWYTGVDGSGVWRIIYCESNDGKNWDNFQLVLNIDAEGTYDISSVHSPYVLKENNIYKMWYSGYDGTYWRILYCESSDGKNWNNFKMVVNTSSEGVYDTNYSYTPTVINDFGVGKMWYSGYDGTYYRIIYCESR